MKKVAIVQARSGSTRLPGKIFKEICGKPMLWHVINRLSYSVQIDKIVIATTTASEDDSTEKFCIENRIEFFRGSVENVLSRYYESALQSGADIIIRVTSDCPMIDPAIIDKMLEQFISSGQAIDYMSNVVERTFPRGLDTEIMTFDTLSEAVNGAVSAFDREHVTPYIYNNPDRFKIANFKNEKDYSRYRLTVDTIEDFNLITRIYNELYIPAKLFLLDDIIDLMNRKPELNKINVHIKQKSN